MIKEKFMAYKTSLDLHDVSLGNIELENKIKAIKCSDDERKAYAEFYDELLRCGGDKRKLIISVENVSSKFYKDNIQVFSQEESVEVCRVKFRNEQYIVVYTSNESFQCSDSVYGRLISIADLFGLILENEQVAGMIINYRSDDIVLERDIIWFLNFIVEMKKRRSKIATKDNYFN